MKGSPKEAPVPESMIPRGLIALLVFASGLAALVYQLLWMKQLGLLFGNTSQAAAVTFGGFFAGLGAGSWWWGRRAELVKHPLRLYARLEWGIALAALVYYLLLHLFTAIYPSIHSAFAGTSGILLAKFLLALLLVFPPAFFMGGTVPVIGQVVVRNPEGFGIKGALYYAINTLGAAAGVFAAAFLLIPAMGYRATYAVAVAISAVIGGVAWKLADREPVRTTMQPVDPVEDTGTSLDGKWLTVLAMAFVSGFVVLGQEVAWTRIFAQVHENSVYSFAVILIVVLIGLAIGSGISSVVARLSREPMRALGWLAAVGGGFLVFCPSLIMHVTHGLEPYHEIEGWGESVRGLFRTGVGGIGYTVVALGMVFPFLMKLAERGLLSPGRTLGRMLAVNTIGAIAGSLLSGFFLLPLFGMWTTCKLLALVYLAAALLLPTGLRAGAWVCRGLVLGMAVLLLGPLDPSGLPVMVGVPGKEPVKIRQTWEASDCTVTVTEVASGHRAIHVNAGYSLGSTSAYVEQANQARIPLHLFPETRSICFIGVGTGMSAGAALDKRFPHVERVVSCELTAEVLQAAQAWIPPVMTGGLFHDPRSTLIVEDGRHFLTATRERFDMINADLFLPYRRGTGSLYSRDYYELVAERLDDDGVFVQWLPMYQLTEREFGIIARTMTEVFGDVTMWRNNFVPGEEKAALIGRVQSSPFAVREGGKKDEMLAAVEGLHWSQTDPDMVRVEAESLPFLYAGNLTKARALFAAYPVNTDDRPVIEYETPRNFREVAQNDKVIWCVGPKFTATIDRIFEAAPLEDDPTWVGHPPESIHLIRAGAAFHRAMVARAMNKPADIEAEWSRFLREWSLGAR